MRCEFFKNKYPEPTPFAKIWKRNDLGEQTIEIICDGSWHSWKDDKGREWLDRCPNANQAEKNKIIERYIPGECPRFESFDANYNNQSSELKQVKEFPASQLQKLILRGDTCTGKTHLAKALFYFLSMRGENCVFHHVEELSGIFRSETKDEDDGISMMDDIWQSAWLFIDDLGTERHTETGLFDRKFKYILDVYQGRIVITSGKSFPNKNIPGGDAFPYSDQTIQRMKSGSRAINFAGFAYRKKETKNKIWEVK